MPTDVRAERYFAAVIVSTPTRVRRLNYERLCAAVKLINEPPWGISPARALHAQYPQITLSDACAYVSAAVDVVNAGIDLAALPD